MRETIILAGGYRLDVRNASAIRALGLAHMFLSLGYRVIVMGKFSIPPKVRAHTKGFL